MSSSRAGPSPQHLALGAHPSTPGRREARVRPRRDREKEVDPALAAAPRPARRRFIDSASTLAFRSSLRDPYSTASSGNGSRTASRSRRRQLARYGNPWEIRGRLRHSREVLRPDDLLQGRRGKAADRVVDTEDVYPCVRRPVSAYRNDTVNSSASGRPLDREFDSPPSTRRFNAGRRGQDPHREHLEVLYPPTRSWPGRSCVSSSSSSSSRRRSRPPPRFRKGTTGPGTTSRQSRSSSTTRTRP